MQLKLILNNAKFLLCDISYYYNNTRITKNKGNALKKKVLLIQYGKTALFLIEKDVYKSWMLVNCIIQRWPTFVNKRSTFFLKNAPRSPLCYRRILKRARGVLST